MKSGRRYQRGYSLMLELVLGMSLVLVVLLAIFQLFPVGEKAVDLADRTTHAHSIARRLMNEELEKEYDEIKDFSGEERIASHTTRRGQPISTDFSYDIKVSENTALKMKDIVVTVHWHSGGADQKRDAFVRLQSARGQLW